MRGYFFNKGNAYFVRKTMSDMETAILFYVKSLEFPYVNNTPYTDAQIYSNIGMAYSSMGKYRDGYLYIMKAYNAGLVNSSILNELEWLKNNHPEIMY